MKKTLYAMIAAGSLFLGCAGGQLKSSKYDTDIVGPGLEYSIHKDARSSVDQALYLKGISKTDEKDRKKRMGVYLLMSRDRVITKKEAEEYTEKLTERFQERLREADKKSDNIDISDFQ